MTTSPPVGPSGPAGPAEPPGPVEPAEPVVRSADLGLARVHLRIGALALARAELETLAGSDALDHDGVLDLIEARWRTGDLAGAGEAAELVLDADGDGPLIALIVAAEAASLRGRPTEARRFADRAVAIAGVTLDAIFAGMPRGSVWPPDATDQPATSPTLFDAPRVGPAGGTGAGRSTPTPAAGLAAALATPVVRPEPETIGLWAAEASPTPVEAVVGQGALAEPATAAGLVDSGPSAAPPPPVHAPPPPVHAPPIMPGTVVPPEVEDLIALARTSLDHGAVTDAVVALGLALRTDPSAAGAVLAAIADRSEPGLALVRGDAYRLVGREAEARLAFAEAARHVSQTGRERSAPIPDHSPEDPGPPSPEGDTA